MAQVSTAPQAKAAILTLLAGRPALATVDRRWGGPTDEDDVLEEAIWLGDVSLEEDWGELGQRRKDETYTIDMTIAVRKYGDDEQGTETRCWALLGEVEQALRADPSLGGLLNRRAELVSVSQTNRPAGPQQWGSAISCSVRCQATKV